MTRSEDENACTGPARDYVERLRWVLVPVHGPLTARPKAPIPAGWPEYRADGETLAEVLAHLPRAGIAVHLGASKLIDVEGDTPEGEALLDGLCAVGPAFPSYRSAKGTHRLFVDDGRVTHLQSADRGIEFRAGRHVSVLPPSWHASGERRYEWVVDPFGTPPPPLPEPLLQLYAELRAKQPPERSPRPPRGGTRATLPFRDDLDYVLRHHDLMGEMRRAGVRFAGSRPDANGNVPCYVPDALRGGNPDETPSGVFNVFNGRLRDFATGTNHRYFDTLAALSGRPWHDLLREYAARAKVAGRPHTRRLGPPPEDEPADAIPLDEARRRVREYLHENLSRPPRPKTLHLVEGPPGIGKTWAACAELAALGTPAVVLTLEHRLARVHHDLLNRAGGRAVRMPVLREAGCAHPDEYERLSRRGYQPSQTALCRARCRVGPKQCRYLLGFADLPGRPQLCCPAVYHTHAGFYAAHGNQDRRVVVFDENCIDVLLSPVCHPLATWAAWGRVLGDLHAETGGRVRRLARRLLYLVRWLTDAGREFQRGDARVRPAPIPAHLCGVAVDPADVEALERRVNARAEGEEATDAPNLLPAALYLLAEPGGCVLLERDARAGVRVRFRRWHRLPEDREVFVLDATADEALVRAVAPGWDVRVWRCPPVEQAGRVVQVMDYDASRTFVRRQLARHSAASPCWLVQVVDAILAGAETAALVSFKAVTDRAPGYDLLARLAHRDKVAAIHHFPCRGVEVPADVLVVLGTPYRHEAAVLEYALALYGPAGLPTSEYKWRPRQDGEFATGNMGYGDQRYAAIERFVVSADLAQAVGRNRPLQNPVTVYVISTAPIPGWRVERHLASELFDLRAPLRRDAARRYQEYAAEAERQLRGAGRTSNAAVCDALGVPRRTGRDYLARFRDQYRDRVEAGRAGVVLWRGWPTTTSPASVGVAG